MRKVNVASPEPSYAADHPEGMGSGVYRLAKDVGAERAGASGSGGLSQRLETLIASPNTA